ncbi:tetratricopeptide repeat protein [Chitiniphilus purpureus]|uniref:Cell division coordinator CpoB n=1 Tax=Chitiniphilus purpureus TaxID=2981137 RepID=A0ABY6DPL6_9NEIS|nr:YbgF trimerization domain-containing protein [Chitiniphilus sp. CD1]UXY15638.1 tetratricopeptide repeat protein [Chitiniphilus sp. CD1]
MNLPTLNRFALVTVLALSLPAHASLLSDREAREGVQQLQLQLKQQQERLTQLESGARRMVELSNQIEGLRQEIASLRGQLEVLQYNLESAEKRQKDLYVDLDNRVRAIEEARVAQAKAQQAAVEQSLGDAVQLARSGKHKDAVAGLRRFITEHPASPMMVEAQYWLGTSLAALKDLKGAEAAYGVVLDKAPDDPLAADALFGLAVVANAKGDKKAARGHLLDLIERYPTSDKAEAAKKALLATN